MYKEVENRLIREGRKKKGRIAGTKIAERKDRG
jgi:hypothetical protein